MAQNIKGKIIDATTGKHYANIKVNEQRKLVSNAEGYFMLSENNRRNEIVLSVLFGIC
jgi:hypothetical protein